MSKKNKRKWEVLMYVDNLTEAEADILWNSYLALAAGTGGTVQTEV